MHAALFLALAGTGVGGPAAGARAGVGLVLYAGVSEVLQAVLPIERDGSVRDALADVVGRRGRAGRCARRTSQKS